MGTYKAFVQENLHQEITATTAYITRLSLTTEPIEAAYEQYNKNRRGFIVYNVGEKSALISYGSGISELNFTAEITPGGYFEDSTKKIGWQGSYMVRAKLEPTEIVVTELLFF